MWDLSEAELSKAMLAFREWHLRLSQYSPCILIGYTQLRKLSESYQRDAKKLSQTNQVKTVPGAALY